jgi:hypothetical protein
MGRATWGTTNLSSNTSLYSSDYRTMSGGSATNQSQSDYIRSGVSPYLYFGNSGSTNSNYGTYVYNKGYVYGIKLTNDSPSYGTIKVYRSTTQVTSTGTPGGSTNDNNQYVSANYSYIGIVFTVSAGGTFNGWRTSPNGAGSSITTSNSYNAYYTDSWIYNYNQWYTYTAAAVSSDSKVLGVGTPAFRACFSWSTQLVHYDDNYTALSAPALYRNSGLTAYANFSNNASNGTNYRYWSSSYWSSAIQFCSF